MESYKKQSFKTYIPFKKDWLLALSNHLRSNHLRSKYKYIYIFVHSIKMLKISLNESKQIAKMALRGYNAISEERLVSSLDESESVKESEKNFDDARIEMIKNDFNKLRDRSQK